MAEDSNPTTEQGAPSKSKRKSRRKWILLALAMVFIIAAVLYGAYYYFVARFYAATDDAYVHGNKVTLASQIAGTVTSIKVHDTDRVKAGQTVVKLDDTQAKNALAKAKSNLAETVRSVHELYVKVHQQKAVIAERHSALAQARRNYHRDKHLIKAHAVTRQKFQQSRSTYHQDQSALNAARAHLAQLQAQTDGTTLRHQPRVKQAEAKLRSAYLTLARTRIPAPVSGYVAKRNVQVGQHVAPGKSMLTIVPLGQIWVNANFKETDLGSVRIGQPVTVTSDFYGSNVVYHGHVAGISPGSGSAFSLLPAQNATGNWIKIVRRVPVRIALNSKDLKKHPLRLGLSMHVSINLHNTSGPMLSKSAPKKPRNHTNVYQNRLAGAKQLIHKIVNANDGHAGTQTNASHAGAQIKKTPG